MKRVLADADVVQQAHLARELAPERCAATGCDWYHGIWPTLRALNLVASPDRHVDLFRSAVQGGAERILVSGAADARMLGLVLDALDERDERSSVTVLDRCATPVAVSIEAAARRGWDVEGRVEDVLLAEDGTGFDLVCTHGLLPMTRREDRPALCTSWFRLLRPGGRVVTTSSLSAADAPDPLRFAPGAVDAFAQQARAAAESPGAERLAMAPADVEAAARLWAARAEVHPVRSADELRDLLEAAGLHVDDLHVREVDGPLGRESGGPWAARAARYAEVVASRPA